MSISNYKKKLATVTIGVEIKGHTHTLQMDIPKNELQTKLMGYEIEEVAAVLIGQMVQILQGSKLAA